VLYTVRSKGRAIGITDLGFVCVDVHHRMGWFHPNELGERVMPHISALLPALRASVGEYDESFFTLDSGILNAKEPYEEALRRVDALKLTFHREDGTRVETESLAISDTELLIALARRDDEIFDDADWLAYEDLSGDDGQFKLSAELDAMLAPPVFEPIEPWQSEETSVVESVEFPRFQIYVEVATPLDDAPVVADDERWR
jgi:hypothetical protein